MEVGELVTSSEKFDKLINENKEANLKNILNIKYYLEKMFFVKNYLTKNYSRWVKQKTISTLEKLKNNYIITSFSEKAQSSRAECLINSLKDENSRQKGIEKRKKK